MRKISFKQRQKSVSIREREIPLHNKIYDVLKPQCKEQSKTFKCVINAVSIIFRGGIERLIGCG